MEDSKAIEPGTNVLGSQNSEPSKEFWNPVSRYDEKSPFIMINSGQNVIEEAWWYKFHSEINGSTEHRRHGFPELKKKDRFLDSGYNSKLNSEKASPEQILREDPSNEDWNPNNEKVTPKHSSNEDWDPNSEKVTSKDSSNEDWDPNSEEVTPEDRLNEDWHPDSGYNSKVNSARDGPVHIRPHFHPPTIPYSTYSIPTTTVGIPDSIPTTHNPHIHNESCRELKAEICYLVPDEKKTNSEPVPSFEQETETDLCHSQNYTDDIYSSLQDETGFRDDSNLENQSRIKLEIRRKNKGIIFDDNSSEEENNSEEEINSGRLSRSPQRSQELVMIRAKHDLLVTLMKEVYAKCDLSWDPVIRKYADSNESSQAGSDNRSENAGLNEHSNLKKRSRRDKSQPRSPDDPENNKRRRPQSNKPSSPDGKKPFACPFNKYDARTYQHSEISDFRYRSCLARFKSISHVKQHLQRVHRPIQCQRCWTILKNSEELTSHLNEEIRCEKQLPRFENVSQSKMDQISSKWGATWENIYEILFPGAPVPSPFWEAQSFSDESSPGGGVRFQDFRGFEAYSRRVLPQLVEAHLSAAISADLEPIEEKLKALVGETLRKCQSILCENYQKSYNNSTSSVISRKTSISPPNEPGHAPLSTDTASSSALASTETRKDTEQRQSNDSGFTPLNAVPPEIDRLIENVRCPVNPNEELAYSMPLPGPLEESLLSSSHDETTNDLRYSDYIGEWQTQFSYDDFWGLGSGLPQQIDPN